MTYGWAILVVMIVGIVMWQLGIFNVNQSAPTSSGFVKIKPIDGVTQYNAAGTLTITLTNGAGKKIDIGQVTAPSGCTTATVSATPATASPMSGEATTFSFTCATKTKGDMYEVKINVPYTLRLGTVTNTATEEGLIKGPVA